MDNQLQDYLKDRRNVWIQDPLLWSEEVIGIGKKKLAGDEKPITLDTMQKDVLIAFSKVCQCKEKKAFGNELIEAEKEYAKKIGLSIQSAKGVGKTALASLIGLYFFVCFRDARVVILGPKYDQIKANLWPEFSKWIGHSIEVFGEDSLLNQLIDPEVSSQIQCVQVPKIQRGKQWRIFIQTFSKNASLEDQKASIQGNHDDYMLFLIDEASAFPDHMFEPIESTLSGGKINLVFAIFNPNKNKGWAIETQGKMKHRWIHKQISAYDSERVSDTQIEYMREKYGVDSNKFRVSILGQPPLAEEGALIPWSWIQDAKERWATMVVDDSEPLLLGADIGGGGDPSMIAKRHGMKVLGFEQNTSEDTESVANWVARIFTTLDPRRLYADSNGIGNTVYYILKRMFGARSIKGVNVKKRAFDENKFEMLRDELFWRVREACESGELGLPDDDELEGELSLLKYDDDGTSGKIKVISKQNSAYKKEMQSLLGYKSPNKADSIALTFYDNFSSLMNTKLRRDDYKRGKHTKIKREISWMAN